MQLPLTVSLCEVGPRDGFQFEDKPIPVELKVRIIGALVEAGLKRIQVTSFVHPEWVPQMADAEALCRLLPDRPGVVYSGLVLNRKGLDRALDTGLTQIDLSLATNETHSRDNVNRSVDEAAEEGVEMVRKAIAAGRSIQVGLQTVFGYAQPGDTPIARVLQLIDRFLDLGIESLSLADTTGLANPVLITERLGAIRAITGETPIVLHLHDTRGLGLANIYAALNAGIIRFDTSMGGLGGCPFIPGAAGNVATEDVVYLLSSMGIDTGIDLSGVSSCTRVVEEFLGRKLPGKMHHLV